MQSVSGTLQVVSDNDSHYRSVLVIASAQEGHRAFGAGRITPQRAAIVDAAARMGTAFTIDDLAVAARGRDANVGVATVYRAVSVMEESGWLERVGERAGSALYARCAAAGHHHHLICTTCGRMEPAECPLGSIASSSTTAGGFVVTDHRVTLYGLCPDCIARPEV
jgi:Fur family ferric uptake transcriptional regulator